MAEIKRKKHAKQLYMVKYKWGERGGGGCLIRAFSQHTGNSNWNNTGQDKKKVRKAHINDG